MTIPILCGRLPHQCAHWFAMTDFFACFLFFRAYYLQEGIVMKENEKKPTTPWEFKDPKPPVIRSGHMENRTK